MILRFPQPTPREEGYRWPAEWEQHEATFLAWPHDLVTWGHALEAVEDDFARFTAVRRERPSTCWSPTPRRSDACGRSCGWPAPAT
jgi:agmatine/peptidylarginine deiminase